MLHSEPHPAPRAGARADARPDATLAEWLSAHARAVGARRLGLDVGGGVLVALGAARWRPPGWPALLGAALCFAAFGAWAFAERRLAERAPAERAPGWRLLRAAAALAGTLAATLAVFGFLFGVLGTWIS